VRAGILSRLLTLTQKFDELRARNERALVLFLTAGDQPLSELPAILETLTEGGADVIEVGIPFSDPFGEGPTIQASSQRSLENGTSARAILDTIQSVSLPIPVVTMGYYNPILRMGLKDFAQRSAAAGIAGTIVSDLIPDESDDWGAACAEAGLETIFLVAPTSTDARIQSVAARSTGFVYAVSRTGVTGAENQVPAEIGDLIAKVRSLTDKPVCVGFGVSSPAHVKLVCQTADGAVVGSALVKLLHERWDGGKGRTEILNFVRSLKEATRG
jgi:tryptophan synthase alpha chain